ncbi:MAG: 4Fe-4S dicluster domain-containing protein [Candidatus Coatesbacteria bacterium]|nr:4Fe-4S dicluster domain-containing protein [Candidatus Coatesbacteria bacterium]
MELETNTVGPRRTLSLCTGCDACVRACPAAAWLATSERPLLRPERCTGCGVCVAACPEGALAMTSGDGDSST